MIHSIGHSNHPIGRFIELLRQHGITVVADVRSTPYSRFNPQFRRDQLQGALRDSGIQYVFLGEELGARTRDPACYEADGRVSYTRLAGTDLFRRGMDRLRAGMSEYRISLMCAEREPLECHRAILIARELERAGIPVVHILADSTLETHEHAMQRLAESLGLIATDLFRTQQQIKEQAYDLQAARIAYVRKSP
jgi:uncharacterized protein (DUF488 family)